MPIIKLYFTSVTALLIITINLQAVNVSWEIGNGLSDNVHVDIRTDGVLVEGRNYGSATNFTAKGVTFAGFNAGEFTSTLTDAFGTGFGNNLTDSGYRNLLSTAAYSTGGAEDVRLTGLTKNHSYLVQLWYVDTRTSTLHRTATITSDQNGPHEATGNFVKNQYIVGRFTADATTLAFNLNTSALEPQLNALQLRLVGVPETNTYALIFGGLSLGMVLMIRQRCSKNLN